MIIMRLDELIEEVRKVMPVEVMTDNRKAAVAGITDNTAEVEAGFIFVCIKGTKFDGHDAA